MTIISRKEMASSLLVLACGLLRARQVHASPGHLREGNARHLLPHWLCNFFDDTIDHHCIQNSTHNVSCPLVEPLPDRDPDNTTFFDLDSFTAHSWFVQKQQINGFQPSLDDFYCLVHTFAPRAEDEFLDYIPYGNHGHVNGPQQHWEVGKGIPESLSSWCGGQDEEGGGLLRISPCLLRSLLQKVGFPMWVIAVAPDYSWAIMSGGEPQDVRQVHPTPLCTTRTNVSATVLADTSGSGLWLLTQERVASNETIAEMESTLHEMGIYTEDLHPVVQEGCSYNNSNLIE